MKEISLHILDAVRNSIEAGATRVAVTVTADSARDTLTVDIVDNGRGLDPAALRRVTDPFYTTRKTRRVGLGLSLFAATARLSGGRLEVVSAPGQGTRVTATMRLGHIDRPPLGDIATTLACLLAANPSLELEYTHRADGREFALKAGDLWSGPGETSARSAAVFSCVRDLIDAGLRDKCGSLCMG